MSKAKRMAIVFSGDFPEGNTKNARLKLVASELNQYGWVSSFFSSYPYRFSKTLFTKQPRKWEQFSVLFFSLSRRYPFLFIFRILQIIVSHITILLWTVFSRTKYSLYYYYNPRWTDTLPSLLLNRLLGRKCIVDQTELFSSGKNSRWHRTEEYCIAKVATLLLVISQKLYDHYSLLRTRPIYKLPIIVDIERFNTFKVEQQYLLGYIGSFAAKDGVDVLLQATKILAKDNPKIMLRLIGYNPDMPSLKKRVQELKIEKNIEITGTVAFDEIPWLLTECDSLIMNRDNSDFATYGYPIKLGEYLACKRPVLMSDGGGFAADFEDRNHVYKFKVDDPESLAKIIRLRYKKFGESDAIAKRGYEYAQNHFDRNKLGLYLLNIIKEI